MALSSETASLASSIASDSDDIDPNNIDSQHKYHPPRISSKTYMHQQTTETIEEDPDEDSENGDPQHVSPGPTHPGVQVTKATDTVRPVTPPNLTLRTHNLNDERPLEMRHGSRPTPHSAHPSKDRPDSARTSGTSSPNGSITASQPPSAKKEKGFLFFPKFHRSKSSDPLSPSRANFIKDSVKAIFSHSTSALNINGMDAQQHGKKSSSSKKKPSSAPGTPDVLPVTPQETISANDDKTFPPPRRVSSVGPSMMLNKGPPQIKTRTLEHEETNEPAIGIGHKAGRSPTDPPATPGVTRAKTLKEYGIKHRGKQAGKGATSTVTQCMSHGRAVALKTFKKPHNTRETPEEQKRRIDIEYEIAHNLHHPNVIETMELLWDESKHNWAETMEWCGGGDLYSIIQHGNMTQVEKDCCFKQLVRGVAYMHSQGIVHRDIKPENLLLNDEGQLKITDFGVSDVVDCNGNHRLCHGLCGSEPYMAPEVHQNEGFTNSTSNLIPEYEGFPLDIWSCGIVYICLIYRGKFWSKATMDDPNYARYIRCLRENEATKARKEAQRTAEEEAKKVEEKLLAEKAAAALNGNGDDCENDKTHSDEDHLNITRNSSNLSFKTPSPTDSPPNGFVTPKSPALSRQSSFGYTPLEWKTSNNNLNGPPPARSKTYKQTPSTAIIKPDNMIQSPLPIAKAAGAVKGEVHAPQPRFAPFDHFPSLQKRLMYRILDPNPATRITAAEILKDPWFKDIQCCSFDPDEMLRVQSGIFDAGKMGNMKKSMPVKHLHPKHLIPSSNKMPLVKK